MPCVTVQEMYTRQPADEVRGGSVLQICNLHHHSVSGQSALVQYA